MHLKIIINIVHVYGKNSNRRMRQCSSFSSSPGATGNCGLPSLDHIISLKIIFIVDSIADVPFPPPLTLHPAPTTFPYPFLFEY